LQSFLFIALALHKVKKDFHCYPLRKNEAVNKYTRSWTAQLIKQKDQNRIAVQLEKNESVIARIKQFEDARRTKQKKFDIYPILSKVETIFRY
jgi:hypothetical protein